MKQVDLTPEEQKWADEALRRNVEGIGGSDIFVSMLNGHFDDPIMVMQTGLAIMMDKPIHLLVNKGAHVPENMRKVAASIHEVDYDDTAQLAAAIEEIQAT